MKVSKKNTEILKVKISNDKLVANYSTIAEEVVVNGTQEYVLKQRPVHPDLENAVKALSKYLAKVHYISDKNKDKVSATGASMSGDNSEKVVITGKLIVGSGKVVAINTDCMSLESEIYGFEEDLETDVTTLLDETHEYLFEGKQSQQVIDFEEDNQEEK